MRLSLLLPVCLALAACGGAKSAASPTSTSGPTPVPTQLISYSANVDPMLMDAITRANAALAKMKSSSGAALASACASAAQNISSLRSTAQGLPTPAGGSANRKESDQGFSQILAGLSECSIGSDERSSGEMHRATNDLQNGISHLTTAETQLANWRGTKPLPTPTLQY